MTVTPAVLWLAAMIIFLVVEAVVPGLVSIWFALGALAAFISALLKAPIWLQAVWFALVSILMLILTRPLAQKYVNSKIKPTNADMVIGEECVVTEEVNNIKETGAVKVRGRVWTARSENGSIISEGSIAKVLKIEGVKLIIKGE